MKISSRHAVTRRDLMKVMGAAALALPSLELFQRSVHAQSAGKKSKYIVFCYTPDGVNQARFWPSGTPSNYTLSPILEPFTKYKDKLLVLGPLMNGARPAANTGLAYFAPVAQHQAPVTLTARAGHTCTGQFCNGTLGIPYFTNQATAVNRLDKGPSIDQLIAAEVKGDSPFGSLDFGMHARGGDTPSDINYQADGTPLKRLESDGEAWDFMFGRLATDADKPSPLLRHAAVTDFLHSQFKQLRPTLSAVDQKTLDSHLDSMTIYEGRVQKRLEAERSGQAACRSPTRRPVTGDARTGADTETLSPFFMDMVAAAFQCNLTKVASVSFGHPGGGGTGGLRMPWLGFTDPMHFLSHHAGNATRLDRYAQMSTWIAGQIAGLMDRLAAIPSATGSGTLLDETTIYWFNRHGDGDSHSNFALPNVILGGTGGYFQMGRWLQMPKTNPTSVLISLANAMGVDAGTFGEEGLSASSGLAGLTA